MDTGKTPVGEKHKGIFLVGSAGLAGAAILAKEKREDLLTRFRPGFTDRAAEVAKLLPGKDAIDDILPCTRLSAPRFDVTVLSSNCATLVLTKYRRQNKGALVKYHH